MKSLKIKKNNILIILIIILMAIAAFSNEITLLVLMVLTLMFVYINWNAVATKELLVPKITISLLLFQNFAIGIGAHIIGNFSSGLSWITQVPTLFISIGYLSIVLKNHLRKQDFAFALFCALCLFYFFNGSDNLIAKITYFRNFVIFYMSFRIGVFYINTKDKLQSFVDFFINLSVIAVVFGLLGILLGKSFYQSTGVLEVYMAKQYTAYRDGLPGNFQTIFFGTWVNRFASLYYEPVNFSYYMALACLVVAASKRKTLFMLFVICEILTFGKGGLLIFGLTLICVITQRYFSRYNVKAIRFIIIMSSIIAMASLVYIIQTKFEHDFGTYNHFYGMSTGLQGVIQNPLGYGLGTAGNLIKTAEVNSQEVSETGLINLAYQIGILGAGLFCYLFLSTASGAFIAYRKNKDLLCLVCSFLPFVLLVVSIYQENTYTPQCVVPYMLLIGGATNANIISERVTKDKWRS